MIPFLRSMFFFFLCLGSKILVVVELEGDPQYVRDLREFFFKPFSVR